ncbi:MAG TPA: glycosyltransferase family 2 protein [Acidimicrobiia bacterium]|nr:glycosyltransferase family 2 protein [Acidimicrobiia bacterium]
MTAARSSQPTARKTVVIVPAYNEEHAVAGTVADVRAAVPDLELLVVDDGSADTTAAAAERAGAHTLRLLFNTGVGGAVRTGLRFAHYGGYDRAVVIDADGQHSAEDIPTLLAALDGGADLVAGSRFAEAAAPYRIGHIRRGAMRLLAWITRRVTGQRFTDVTSGFRAFNRQAIELFAVSFPSEYLADTVEVLLIAFAHGLCVTEVPVHIGPRQGGKPSTRHARLVLNYLRLLVAIAGSGYGRQGRKLRKGSS